MVAAMNAAVTSRPVELSESEARNLTQQIKRDAQDLWKSLLQAHDGRAHAALGYATWEAYCAAEFDISRARAYQLVNAGRVARAVSTNVDASVPSEAVAREFSPLADDPEKLREVHAEASKTAPIGNDGKPKLTARHVRNVVQKRKQNSAVTKPDPEAQGAIMRPGGDVGDELEIPTLNAAVAMLKRSVSRDLADVDDALEMLKRSADLGLYRPKNDAPAAFKDLVEIVGALVERVRGECS